MGNFNKIVLDDETLEVEDTKARTDIGDVSNLQTTTKDNLVKAVNECFRSASDGKALIASAITGKGVNTDSGATYAAMAENIGSIQVGIDTSDATATAGQMLSGSTAYVKGEKVTGTLTDYRGQHLGNLQPGETYLDDGTPVRRLYLSGYLAVKRSSNSLALIRIKLSLTGVVDQNTYVDVPLNNLSEGNIRSGVLIGDADRSIGVTGTFTSDATATDTQILEGSIAYVRGNKVTGTMPNRKSGKFGWCGYETVSVQPDPSASDQAQVTVPNTNNILGYYDRTSSVTANIANLNANNIKEGVLVGRYGGDSTNCITGTFTSDGTAGAADILNGKTAYVKGQRITGSIKTLDGIYSGKVDVDDQGNEVPRLSNSNIKRIVRTTAEDGGSVLYNYQIGTTEAGYIPNNSTVYVALQGLVPESIKYGQKIGNPDGTAEQYIEGTYTSDATATAAQILAGAIAYVRGSKVTGTMADKSGTTEYTATATLDSTNSELEMTVPAAGYYTASNKLKATFATIASLIGLTSAKLASGNTILGIAGNSNVVDTSAGTATAAQILSGQVAYVDGARLTGTMADNGAVNQSLAVNGTYTIPAGYHNGSGKVTQSLTTKAAATYTPGDTAQTIAAGQYLNGAQTISAVPTETKTVTAGTAATTVNRTSGKYMTAVTVNPTPSQTKTVTLTSSPLTVLPDAGYLLSGVTVTADLGKKFATGTIIGHTKDTYKTFNAYVNGAVTSDIFRYFVLNCSFVPSVIVFTAGTSALPGYYRGFVSNNTHYGRDSVSYNGLAVQNGYTPINYVTTIGTSTEVVLCTTFDVTTVDITWYAFG